MTGLKKFFPKIFCSGKRVNENVSLKLLMINLIPY